MNTLRGRRGSAIIKIYVSEQADRGYLQVLASIVHPPPKSIAIHQQLLELDLQLTNTSLGMNYDTVYNDR